MNDQDITKLLSKLTKSLATKEDIVDLEMRLGHKINNLEMRLGNKIDDLNDKADTILKFAEAVEEPTIDHEKRLKYDRSDSSHCSSA